MSKKAWMLGAVALAAGVAGAVEARKLDMSKPEDVLAVDRKLACSTVDGEPTFYHWSGNAYSRVPGERDRLLFKVEGMNVRQCASVSDPQRGPGYKMVSREIMLYLDPQTGQVLRTWKNPWTGEDVEVLHVANDPVNMRAPAYARGPDGKPREFEGRIQNGRVFMPTEVPLFYTNPLAGDYQDYVGNKYHAMEIFDFVADEKTLFDSRTKLAYPAVAWVRLADWLPWMKMGGRPGSMAINAMGQMVRGYEDLPKVLRDEIDANYPIYKSPPPLDDTRPNETSWTYFKKRIDAKRAAEPAKPTAGH
jgi:hypothetical protein